MVSFDCSCILQTFFRRLVYEIYYSIFYIPILQGNPQRRFPLQNDVTLRSWQFSKWPLEARVYITTSERQPHCYLIIMPFYTLYNDANKWHTGLCKCYLIFVCQDLCNEAFSLLLTGPIKQPPIVVSVWMLVVMRHPPLELFRLSHNTRMPICQLHLLHSCK